MRRRRVLASIAIAVTLAVGAAAPASASSPAPWQPFRTQPFTEAAGDVCPFALRADPLTDHELYRTLSTYPDGSPREQEFVGPLVIRYTNLSTGASVDRNLTGTAYFFFEPDGSTHGHGLGHLGITIHAGNINPPPGEYILTGDYQFAINADGSRTFDLHGTVENLCTTLS